MSRRMGLAQVLLKEPEVYILDEPTIGLDPLGARDIKDIIMALKREGKTVLFSTHLLSEAEPLCDRIGILYEGRLVTMGSLSELLEQRDEIEIRAKGSGEGWEERVKNSILACGGGIISFARAKEKLEEFYIRTLKK